jgi:DNA-binding SARP family transcriptional activator
MIPGKMDTDRGHVPARIRITGEGGCRTRCVWGRRQAEALEVYHQARELLAGQLGVDPSAQLEQVYLRILRGQEGASAVGTNAVRSSDNSFDTERNVVPAQGTSAQPVARAR